MRRVALAILLTGFAGAVQAGECEVYRVPLRIEADVGYYVVTASGEDCRVAVMRSPEFGIESNEIVAGPRYGGARVDGTMATYYRSNAGYRGADAFAFTLCGSSAGKTACSTVRVKVQVR
jgi:hypothetical protein